MTTLEYISEGAYGSVYSYAVDTLHQQQAFALKHLKHENTSSVISNLQNIQENIQKSSIANCATIEFVKSIKFYKVEQKPSSAGRDYELIVTTETPYNAYTMQLHTPLKKLGGIRQFIKTICSELKCIHAHNIIHGDMKLVNILVHTQTVPTTYIIGDFDGASIATQNKPSIIVFTPIFAHPIMYCYNYSAAYDDTLKYLINFTKGNIVIDDSTNQELETLLHISVFGNSYTLDQLMNNYKTATDKTPYLKYADYYAFLFNIYYKYGIKNDNLANFIISTLQAIAKSLGILTTTTGGNPQLRYLPVYSSSRRKLPYRQMASYKQSQQITISDITKEDYNHPVIIGNTLYSVTKDGVITKQNLNSLLPRDKPVRRTP